MNPFEIFPYTLLFNLSVAYCFGHMLSDKNNATGCRTVGACVLSYAGAKSYLASYMACKHLLARAEPFHTDPEAWADGWS